MVKLPRKTPDSAPAPQARRTRIVEHNLGEEGRLPRLFTGIEVPASVAFALSLIVSSLVAFACGFVGQVADDQLGQVFAHDIRAAGAKAGLSLKDDVDYAVPLGRTLRQALADLPHARFDRLPDRPLHAPTDVCDMLQLPPIIPPNPQPPNPRPPNPPNAITTPKSCGCYPTPPTSPSARGSRRRTPRCNARSPSGSSRSVRPRTGSPGTRRSARPRSAC